MKKKILIGLMIIMLSVLLTGCKSANYKNAVEFQKNGDYASAITIYEQLGDYRDVTSKLDECYYQMAVVSYEESKIEVEKKNIELEKAILQAEALLAEDNGILDETLVDALEFTISKAKDTIIEISGMPDSTEDIRAVINEWEQLNYSEILAELSEAKSALQISIQKYNLVNAPNEDYIIKCLEKVADIVEIEAVTPSNDPNGKLGTEGGYTSQVYFSCSLINQDSIKGNSVVEKGTVCGGSIEVYSTVEDAINRDSYLATFDGTEYESSHYVIGTVIIRTSGKLSELQQSELEKNIIAELINIDN